MIANSNKEETSRLKRNFDITILPRISLRGPPNVRVTIGAKVTHNPGLAFLGCHHEWANRGPRQAPFLRLLGQSSAREGSAVPSMSFGRKRKQIPRFARNDNSKIGRAFKASLGAIRPRKNPALRVRKRGAIGLQKSKYGISCPWNIHNLPEPKPTARASYPVS